VNNTNNTNTSATHQQEIANRNSHLPQVNLTEGFAGTVVDHLVQERLCSNGREQQSEMMCRGNRIELDIQNAKKLTSGVMVANGEYCVSRMHDLITKRDSDHLEKETARAHKAQIIKLKNQIAAVIKIWSEKGDNIQTWNAKECKSSLQYKKLEGYAAMPTKIDELCQLITHCWSPIPSPHSSSDNEEDTEDAPENDAPFLAMLAEVSDSVEA